jgi:hypothetical protein
MNEPLFPWLSRAADALRALAQRRWTLLVVVLALNAVACPYEGMIHDARLYGVQVLNRVEAGAFADDLFFRYGSQDQFTLFSTLMVPLCRLVGVESSFFLAYLAANALLYWALLRVVERLIDNRALIAVVMLCAAAVPLEYGGDRVFHVNEPFLTSRLPAAGFALLGLSLVLECRYVTALLPLTAAALLHPLMAVGAVLVWGFCWIQSALGNRAVVLVIVLGAGSIGAILATPPLALRLFGPMDDVWRDAIRRVTPLNFPRDWQAHDWFTIALGVLGCGYLAGQAAATHPQRAHVLAAIGLVAVGGLAASVVVPWLPYALPLQVQPYRALWLLRVVGVCGCLVLAAALWRSQRLGPGALALVLFSLVLMPRPMALQWVLPLTLLPFSLVASRGLEPVPRHQAWALRGVTLAFVIGFIGWGHFRIYLVLAYYDQLLARVDTLDGARRAVEFLGPVILILAGVLLLERAHRHRRCIATVTAALAIAVCVPMAFGLLPRLGYVQRHHTRYMPDVAFVRDYLNDMRRGGDGMPTIYSDLGHVEYVWLDWHAHCYFDWRQSSGFIFERATAIEGERRARCVGPFEIARFRTEQQRYDAKARADQERLTGMKLDGPAPNVDDLRRLCTEPELDYVVLSVEFRELNPASNGRVYIYDCRRVRAALPAPGGSAVIDAAPPIHLHRTVFQTVPFQSRLAAR